MAAIRAAPTRWLAIGGGSGVGGNRQWARVEVKEVTGGDGLRRGVAKEDGHIGAQLGGSYGGLARAERRQKARGPFYFKEGGGRG